MFFDFFGLIFFGKEEDDSIFEVDSSSFSLEFFIFDFSIFTQFLETVRAICVFVICMNSFLDLCCNIFMSFALAIFNPFD